MGGWNWDSHRSHWTVSKVKKQKWTVLKFLDHFFVQHLNNDSLMIIINSAMQGSWAHSSGVGSSKVWCQGILQKISPPLRRGAPLFCIFAGPSQVLLHNGPAWPYGRAEGKAARYKVNLFKKFDTKSELQYPRSIILCGIETQACIQHTTLDLLERGFEVAESNLYPNLWSMLCDFCFPKVHIPVDCASSRSMVDRRFALERLRQVKILKAANLGKPKLLRHSPT